MNYTVTGITIKHNGATYRDGDTINLDTVPDKLLPYLEEQEYQPAQPKPAKSRKDISNDND